MLGEGIHLPAGSRNLNCHRDTAPALSLLGKTSSGSTQAAVPTQKAADENPVPAPHPAITAHRCWVKGWCHVAGFDEVCGVHRRR
jgi:hypothetical protein